MSLGSWFRNLLASASKPPVEVALGRNDDCWCGSGKKYKKCHLKSDELKRVEANYSKQVSVKNRMSDGVMPGKAKPRRLERTPSPAEKQ